MAHTLYATRHFLRRLKQNAYKLRTELKRREHTSTGTQIQIHNEPVCLALGDKTNHVTSQVIELRRNKTLKGNLQLKPLLQLARTSLSRRRQPSSYSVVYEMGIFSY